jgi:hypothetical protein
MVNSPVNGRQCGALTAIRKTNVADIPLAILMLGGMALGIGGAFKHHSRPPAPAVPATGHGVGGWQRLWQ